MDFLLKKFNNMLAVALVVGSMLSGYWVSAAESIYETCTRRPTVNGWIALGDRTRMVWNENGWLDVGFGKKATRLFRQLQAPLKPAEKFYFEADVMAAAGASLDQFYCGLMTPEGDNFNNFLGFYAKDNAFLAAVVKKDGKDVLTGEATALTPPFIVRVVGEYDGSSKLKVKVLDLLQNKKVISTSELEFDAASINLSLMTVMGVGCNGNKAESRNPLRVDNLYFSTTGPNTSAAMPTFLESEMVKIVSITPIPSLKGLHIIAEIDSLIDADVELKGYILPDKKLKGDEIWSGSLGVVKLARAVRSTIEYQVDNIEAAKPWSPMFPRLYSLNLTGIYNGKPICMESVRFGFRTFESKNGNFLLNGRPIFLRGSSLNPPAPNVLDNIGQKPPFIRDYLRDLKLRNINIIRMQSQNYGELKRWLEACDELGIMVFQGCYGVPPGGTDSTPPKDKDASQIFKDYNDKYFKHYAQHPSVVIYVLANEVGRNGNDRVVYDAWLGRLAKRIKKVYPNVAYMTDSGADAFSSGDIADWHFFAGWYYGSFLDYINFRNPAVGNEAVKDRPLTLSECVGAFTTEKNGFPVHDRQISAGLTWGGNEAATTKAAQRYQAFLTKQAIEQFRRFREYNPRLAGIMPFTVLYNNWQRVRTFSDMKPKPAADQMRVSFQPILLSWECWTPNVYVGSTFDATVHVINDSDSGDDLSSAVIVWELTDNSGNMVATDKVSVPQVKYYQSKSFPVSFKIDPKLVTGSYRLRGDLKWGGKLISSNEVMLYISDTKNVVRDQADNAAVRIFDPTDKLKPALAKLGVRYAEVQNFSSLREGNVLVLGDVDAAALVGEKDNLRKFITDGGRVLVMVPKDNLLDLLGVGTRIKMVPFDAKDGVFINQAREDDLLFKGLPENALSYWNDYTGWNESKPDFPKVSPVNTALALRDQSAVEKTAILANFGRGLANLALVEVFDGEGTVMVSGFDFIPRISMDPVADRFFMNLISYACSKKKHFKFVSAAQKIEWGNLKSEHGIVSSTFNGLVAYGVKQSRMDSPCTDEYLARGRELVGAFRFNSAGEVFCFENAEKVKAVLGMRVPKEWSQITSVVRNPLNKLAELTVQLNQNPAKTFTFEPGEKQDISMLLPEGSLDIKLTLTGTRGLLLESSRFE